MKKIIIHHLVKKFVAFYGNIILVKAITKYRRKITSVHIFIPYNFNIILHRDPVAPNGKASGLYSGDADSNLGRDTDYSKLVFRRFPQLILTTARIVPLGYGRLLSYSNVSFTDHPNITLCSLRH